MKKKWLAIAMCGIAAFSSLSLVSCGEDNATNGLQKSAGITVDAAITESAYKELPTHYTGIKGRLKADFAADEGGLYVGISVKDTDMRYTGSGVEGMLASDYVGIAIDTAGTRDQITAITEKTVLFRFDAKGRYTYSAGNDYGEWEEWTSGEGSETESNEMPKFSYRIDGTALATGDDSEVDGNVGYYGELYFTWAQLGTTATEINKKGKIMYCLEHRDVSWDIVVNASDLGSIHKYNTLTLFGDRKGANMPDKASEVVVDGKLDDAAWANAPVVSSGVLSEKAEGATAGEYTVKAFMGANGIVIGVDVKEKKLVNAQRGIETAYQDCGAEFRIHVFDKDDNALITHKWLFDLDGPKWHELAGGGIDSKYAQYAEWQFDIRGTVNDNSDEDEGWTLELYIPHETLLLPFMNLEADPATCYVKLLPAVASAGGKIALPDNCEWDKVDTYITLKK